MLLGGGRARLGDSVINFAYLLQMVLMVFKHEVIQIKCFGNVFTE